MRESGFDLSEGDDRNYQQHIEAAFDLAHRLTGIGLTPELFTSAEFVCGIVPVPRGQGLSGGSCRRRGSQ